jgi:hypothetical protein
MHLHARRMLLLTLGIALAGAALSTEAVGRLRYYPHYYPRHFSPRHFYPHRFYPQRFYPHRFGYGHRPGFRMRFGHWGGAAAQNAARLGALVGNECQGKAEMPRNDHEWVVLCSNGRTFVIDMPHQNGAPATECSLAGIAPLPACYP